MRIVLIGDIHVYRLWLAPWQLASKRVLGQTNLLLNRRKRFNHAILPGLIQSAIDLEPDLCLLSGDLTTTALRGEFDDVAAALKPLTEQVQTIAVPGNHDRYTYSAARNKLMDRLLHTIVPQSFPHTRPLTDRWRLLALDAAVPRPHDAKGRLGAQQMQAVTDYLQTLDGSQGLVVLCHYPAALPSHIHEHASHAMRERYLLREALAACPARIVYLHGHIHKPWHHEIGDGSGVPFTCIDAGAPCMVSHGYPHGQGFYQIDLPDDPQAQIDVTHHVQ